MEDKFKIFYLKLTIVGSVICFVFFGLSAFEENYMREWKSYQKDYKEIQVSYAQSEKEKQTANNIPIEIKQVILSEFGKVDRCVSCHNGIDDPRMETQQVPHRSHSGKYLKNHPVEKFGCTICHGGQDRALSTQGAFASEKSIHWEYPVIPVKYVQSSCGKCHLAVFDKEQKLPGAEILEKGRNIFLDSGCLGCHNVRGTGGANGGELTNQGIKTKHEYSFEHIQGEKSVQNWLLEHFLDPPEISPGSIMPPIDLNNSDIDALITFTMSLFDLNYSPEYYSIETLNEAKGLRKEFSGKDAYETLCSYCHGAEGEGRDYREFVQSVPGLSNPDFLAAASRDLIKFTINHGRGGVMMSPWAREQGGLHESEVESLVDLVLAWKKTPPGFSEVRRAQKDIQFGSTLYRSRCGTCHGSDGEGGIGPALNLQDFLSLASDEFLYKTISTGRENTAMVGWYHLSAKEMASIIAYLRNWQTVPGRNLSNARVNGDIEKGKALYAGSCSSCHGIYGQGSVGPALFNKQFLAAASDQYILNSVSRGRGSTAMRSFAKEFQGLDQLPAQEIRDIVAYIRSRENVETPAIYTNISPGTPTKGRELYQGMCSGCHGVSGEGKHGPALNSQEFLSAATNGFLQATVALGRAGTAMRSWAKGAQGYEELTADEINDIVAYIRTWQKVVIPKRQYSKARGENNE
ncbi:MAG: c-type cytochrome [bacterium]|nr:c-type cytochrome [bacterium]